MERLDQLIADLRGIDARLDALLAADTLSDDERGEHDKLVAEREKLVKDVAKEQSRLAREQEREKAEADAAAIKKIADDRKKLEEDRKRLEEERARRTVATNRLTDFDQPTPTRATAVSTGIPAEVRRFAVRNFKGTRRGMDAETRAYRFGMWILARLSNDLPGRFKFRQAQQFVESQMSRQMAAAQSNDGTGYSYLIPEEFGQDIIDLREQFGVARNVLKMVPMNSDTRTDPRRNSGLTAYFVAEGAAGTESTKQWSDVRLTAKDLMVLSRYTNQVAADAVINVGDDLAYEISYAFATKEDDCAFNGDGTSTYGGIVGVRTKLVNYDGAGTASAGAVTQATSNTWSSMALVDFHTTVGKLPQYADTQNCHWLCSRQFYFTVMQRLELAAGGNTINEIASGDRRGRPMFLGFPVVFSQKYPTATATTGIMVTLGDHSLAGSFGDRQMDSVTFSEHATVNSVSVFECNQIAVRGTERMDIVIHDVGDSSTAGPIVGLRTG